MSGNQRAGNTGNRLVTGGLIAAIFLLILTASIALPIFIRPFYYAHISTLNLPEETGWSYDQIKRAYDEMINFCTLFTPFSTGELAWSEEGKAHFTDVRMLFTLDWAVMLASVAYIVTVVILARYKKIRLMRFCGHGAGFYAAIAAVVVPMVIGALAAINFEQAFVIFHSIFFPGKSNWMFDPYTDEIIRVMPEIFFRNCAIFIGLGVVISSAVIIVRDCVKKSKNKHLKNKEESLAPEAERSE